MKPPKFTTDQLAAIISGYSDVEKRDLGGLLNSDLSVCSVGRFRRTATGKSAHSILRRSPPARTSETLGPVALVQSAFATARTLQSEAPLSPAGKNVEPPNEHAVVLPEPLAPLRVPISANMPAERDEQIFAPCRLAILVGKGSSLQEERPKPPGPATHSAPIEVQKTQLEEPFWYYSVMCPFRVTRRVIRGKGTAIEKVAVVCWFMGLMAPIIYLLIRPWLEGPPDVTTF